MKTDSHPLETIALHCMSRQCKRGFKRTEFFLLALLSLLLNIKLNEIPRVIIAMGNEIPALVGKPTARLKCNERSMEVVSICCFNELFMSVLFSL